MNDGLRGASDGDILVAGLSGPIPIVQCCDDRSGARCGIGFASAVEACIADSVVAVRSRRPASESADPHPTLRARLWRLVEGREWGRMLADSSRPTAADHCPD
jgi:hypothetical protein